VEAPVSADQTMRRALWMWETQRAPFLFSWIQKASQKSLFLFEDEFPNSKLIVSAVFSPTPIIDLATIPTTWRLPANHVRKSRDRACHALCDSALTLSPRFAIVIHI